MSEPQAAPHAPRRWLRRHLRVGVGLIMAALAFDAQPAQAQTEEQRKAAKEHYDLGTRLYDLGRYGEAAAEYEKAYLNVASPAFLYNIGQAYRLNDQPEEALRAFKAYLRRAPEAADADDVNQKIADLQKQVDARKRPPTDAVPPALPPAAVAEATPPAPAAQSLPPESMASPAPAPPPPTPVAAAPLPQPAPATAAPPREATHPQQPLAVQARAASPEASADAEETRTMSWAITSIRFGVTSARLSAANADFLKDAVSDCEGQTPGGSWLMPAGGSASCDLDFRETLNTLGVSAHLGGNHYFFRMDAGYSWNSATQLYGVGIYPLNFGWYIPQIRLFPYATSGVALDYVSSRKVDEKGVLVRPRLGVGAKYRYNGTLGASLDMGLSPGAVGFLVASAPNSQNGEATSDDRSRGGVGTVFDVMLGVDWF